MLKNLALWVFVTSSGQTIGINFWATHAPMVPRLLDGRCITCFRSTARGRRRSNRMREEVLRTWGNARFGTPCDELHLVGCRNPGSLRRRRVAFADTTCPSEKISSLRNSSPGGVDVHRYRSVCQEVANQSLAFCARTFRDQLIQASRKIGDQRPSWVDLRIPRPVFEIHQKLTSVATTPKAAKMPSAATHYQQ